MAAWICFGSLTFSVYGAHSAERRVQVSGVRGYAQHTVVLMILNIWLGVYAQVQERLGAFGYSGGLASFVYND